MIRWEQFMDIKSLAWEGVSRREIARLMGVSRNTVRKVVKGTHKIRVERRSPGSKLHPFKDHVRSRYEAYSLSAVRLIEELRPLGYSGSIATLRRFLRELKGPAERLKRATVRCEVRPASSTGLADITPKSSCPRTRSERQLGSPLGTGD
jgi:transposase